MKQFTLIILSIVILNAISKESTIKESTKKDNIVIDRMPDHMQHAYSTNDPFILQHQAVIFIFLFL